MQATLFDTPAAQTYIKMPEVIKPAIYPPVMDVINKIMNVKKSNISRISVNDLAEMTRLQQDFDNQNTKLNRWEMLLKFEIENLYPGGLKIETEEAYPEYPEVSITKPEIESDFSQHEFDPQRTLESVLSIRYKLQKDFWGTILTYFKNTYSLEYFNDDDYKALVRTTYNYEVVLDHVFTKISTSSLKDAARQKMISNFYKILYGKMPATVDKNKIQFPSLSFWRFETSNEDFLNFFTALGFFETGETGTPLYGEIPIGGQKQSGVYQLQGKKVTSIRFYQNGKAILYFINEAAANEFYNLF